MDPTNALAQLLELTNALEADLKALGFPKPMVWVGAGSYMTGWHVDLNRADPKTSRGFKTYVEAREYIDSLGVSPLSPAFAEAEVNSWLGALQHVC